MPRCCRAVSVHAPKAPIENGPTHGSILAFKVALDETTRKPTLKPAWVSRDFDVPDPPVVANGVLFALSTGENPMQTTGTKVIYSGQKLLTDQERAANTHNAELYALDAKTGKLSIAAATPWRRGSISAVWPSPTGRSMPWITTRISIVSD